MRDFSDREVDLKIIENAVLAAATGPSGANKQPWHFSIISDPKIKRKIRLPAEVEEREFYAGRAPQTWLDDLQIFETDEHKPFLETVPYLIVVFLQRNSIYELGNKHKNYYMPESVGNATGILMTA